eukprot:gene17555-17758_t
MYKNEFTQILAQLDVVLAQIIDEPLDAENSDFWRALRGVYGETGLGGYRLNFYDRFNQNSFSIDFSVRYVLCLGEGMDGYNDPAPSFSYVTPQVLTTGTSVTIAPAVTSGWYGTGTVFASVPNTNACFYSGYNGDIYATSPSTNNAYIYNSSGALIGTQLGSIYTYNAPQAIITDAAGNTYVANSNNGTVVKVSPSSATTIISGFQQPIGLVLDPSGNLYVTDHMNGNIYKVSAGSTTATVFLSGFSTLWGIAINTSGDMFVSEAGVKNDILKITNALSGGNVQSSFGSGFNSPRFLAFDSSGFLFVADCNNSTVKKISPDGTVANVISSALLTQVVGVSVDASGNIYASSFGNSEVLVFAPISYTITPALPAGLHLDAYTGVISGIPTGVSATTVYTVTANNGSGTNTAAISLTVNPSLPTVTNASICGTGNATLTASGSLPAGGTYNWYNASSGGTLLQSTTSATYTANFLTSSNLYVSYTSGGISTTLVPVTVTVTPVVSSPLSGALLAFPFNGDTNDITGNNNTGIPEPSVVSGPTLTTDRYGNANSAYSFNGINQYLTTTTKYANLQIFTISLWFNTTVAGGKLIGYGNLQTGASNNYDRHLYMNNAGQLFWGVYPGTYCLVSTTSSYNDGYWHHVVASIGPTYGLRLYVDDVLQGSNPSFTVPAVSTGYWRIAYDNLRTWPSSPSSNYYSGKLDDIAVYNSELTPSQITTSDNLNLIGTTKSKCGTNSITLTAPAITGAAYSWFDGATTITGNPATFPNAVTGSYTLTVTPGGGSCSSTATFAPGSGTVYTWSGASSSTDPTVAGNWAFTTAGITSQAPSFNGNENLVIPSGLTYYPSLTGNESIYSLSLASGALLNLNGFTLSVGCDIYNSAGGQILYGGNTASGITLNGSVANQNYTGGNISNTAELGNLTINNSAGGTVNIIGGSSPAALTLISNATGSASVATLPSGSTISGKATVQRYMSAYRGYRLLAAPTHTARIS